MKIKIEPFFSLWSDRDLPNFYNSINGLKGQMVYTFVTKSGGENCVLRIPAVDCAGYLYDNDDQLSDPCRVIHTRLQKGLYTESVK